MNTIIHTIHHVIQRYPDLAWDWKKMSNNRLVPLWWIVEHKDKTWDWVALVSQRNDVTPKFLEQVIDDEGPLELVDYLVKHDEKVTPKIVTQHKLRGWNFRSLSMNDYMTPGFILENMNMDWIWGSIGISSNPNLTAEFMLPLREKKWCYRTLSSNPSLPREVILEWGMDLWDVDALRNNIGVPIEFANRCFPKRLKQEACILTLCDEDDIFDKVSRSIDEPWDFKALSSSGNLPTAMVEKYPHKPWCFKEMSTVVALRSDIEQDFIEKFIDENWDFRVLSKKFDLTPEFFEKYIHKNWCFYTLSQVYGISTVAEKYPSKEWDWYNLTGCFTTNLDFVLRHPDLDWNWGMFDRLPVESLAGLLNKPLDWWQFTTRMSYSFIRDNANFPWMWSVMHVNRTLTEQDVRRDSEMPWDWKLLTERLGPMRKSKRGDYLVHSPSREFIKDFLHKPLDRSVLPRNEELDFDFLTQVADCSMEDIRSGFVRNPNITEELVRNTQGTIDWDYGRLSSNLSISLDFIIEHPDMGWDWYYVSSRSDLTMDAIRPYMKSPWDPACVFKTIGERGLTLEFIEEMALSHAAGFPVSREDSHLFGCYDNIRAGI